MACDLTLPRMINFTAENLTAPSGGTLYCPWCGDRMGTKESRPTNSFGPVLMRRIKFCASCNKRFSTVEIQTSDLLDLLVSHSSGSIIDNAIEYLEGLRAVGKDWTPGPENGSNLPNRKKKPNGSVTVPQLSHERSGS